MEAELDTHNSDLAFTLKRRTKISPHHALLTLKICLGAPRHTPNSTVHRAPGPREI